MWDIFDDNLNIYPKKHEIHKSSQFTNISWYIYKNISTVKYFWYMKYNVYPKDIRILHFQISRHHQKPKHKTRNTFHWITWEVNTVC